jgi:hypothetical protein
VKAAGEDEEAIWEGSIQIVPINQKLQKLPLT